MTKRTCKVVEDDGVVAVMVTGNGHRGLIDSVDRSAVENVGWCGAKRRDGAICFRAYPRIYLHRVIAGAEPGDVVDHINGDTSDNRRSNLRICTLAENNRNQRKMKGIYPFKGVRFRNQRWVAYATREQRHHHIGTFDTIECAARAYDDFARAEYGEFACVNFPRNGEQGALSVNHIHSGANAA